MPAPLVTSLPIDCILSSGYVIRINALDLTTGAEVAGVKVTDVSLFVEQLNGPAVDATPTPLLVPSVGMV